MPPLETTSTQRNQIRNLLEGLTDEAIHNIYGYLQGRWPLPKGETAPVKGYTQDQWNQLLDKTVLNIDQLALHKGGEYAHGDDRLDNFRRNGQDVGLAMEVIWRVYAGKHWDSITTYIRDLQSGTDRVRSEPIQGRADDLIVYLILFKAMCEERGQK